MAASNKLADAEVTRKLKALNGWKREDGSITKEFLLGGFTEAAAFIGKIAPVANEMDHHPDVQLYRYKRVKVILTTHDAGGVTDKDFELASKIDRLAA